MTIEEKQLLCAEAFDLVRAAQKDYRWAYLNEEGAFRMRDAVAKLRIAVANLQAVSDAVLLEQTDRYGKRAVSQVRVA